MPTFNSGSLSSYRSLYIKEANKRWCEHRAQDIFYVSPRGLGHNLSHADQVLYMLGSLPLEPPIHLLRNTDLGTELRS